MRLVLRPFKRGRENFRHRYNVRCKCVEITAQYQFGPEWVWKASSDKLIEKEFSEKGEFNGKILKMRSRKTCLQIMPLKMPEMRNDNLLKHAC